MNRALSASTRHRLARSLPIQSLESRRLLAALTSGTAISDSVTSGQTDTHTINVSAGVPFIVAVHDTSNNSFQPRVRIYGPDNTKLFDAADGAGLVAEVATASSGSYRVEISGNTSAGGNYTAIAFAGNSAGTIITTESGRRRAPTVSPNEITIYSIDAQVGNQVSATATENTGGLAVDPKLTLIAPDGTIVGQASSETGVRFTNRATKAGNYYAIVSDDGDNDTAPVGVTMTRLPGLQATEDPDTIGLQNHENREIDLPTGDADVFQIENVKAGDTLSVSLTASNGSNLDPDIVLYGPDGTRLVEGSRANGASTLSTTANANGSYWVIARDYEADDGGKGFFRYDLTSNNNSTPQTRVINGTEGNDVIKVEYLDGGSIRVDLNGGVTDYDLEPGDKLDIRSGGGNDLIDLRKAAATSYVATSGTYVSAGGGDDTVYGSVGNDTITGGAGRNRLFGNDGADRINGSGGRDFLYGEGGNDRLYGQGGNDQIDGGGNVDRLYGGDGNDLLLGANSNDLLYAGAGDDTLIGGRGNDYLNGESGTDVVQNKEDGDTLISIESVV